MILGSTKEGRYSDEQKNRCDKKRTSRNSGGHKKAHQREGVMVIVRGTFTKLLIDKPNFAFWDECSKTRHFFAGLGLCKHRGEWLNAKQYFHRIYRSAEVIKSFMKK